MDRDVNGLEVLTRDECLHLLSTRSLGRIAVSSRALPVILPVNYVLIGDEVVMRTRSGTRLDAATRQAIVAFEVDEIDGDTGAGWSVMAQGIAREVTEPSTLDVARAAPLARWLDPVRGRHVAISLDVVSGRRIGATVP
jgi:nitroimidazol reductase NimA-like FMN-containing flavoprotein (pyridoxamine 5'-phosphate oxidase superfamily)